MDFSYDSRSGTLKVDDKFCVYHIDNTDKFYYKKHGKIIYLTPNEVADLCRTANWFIDKYDSDFGEELNNYFVQHKSINSSTRTFTKYPQGYVKASFGDDSVTTNSEDLKDKYMFPLADAIKKADAYEDFFDIHEDEPYSSDELFYELIHVLEQLGTREFAMLLEEYKVIDDYLDVI